MDEDEVPLLLGMLNRLLTTTPPDSLLAGFIAYWIADGATLFQAVPQSTFIWPDPRGVDEPIWSAIQKLVRRKLTSEVARVCRFDAIADRLTLDDIDLSLLRHMFAIQHSPRVRELFDQLILIGELGFVETIAICTGLAPRDVALRLAQDARLAQSGSVIIHVEHQGGAERWTVSPLLYIALAMQHPC